MIGAHPQPASAMIPPKKTPAAAPARRMTGAQICLESLLREGVDTIFGYPGGANLYLYRWLPDYPNLHHILVRHEQGAAHAADGYARSRRGAVGVCFATSIVASPNEKTINAKSNTLAAGRSKRRRSGNIGIRDSGLGIRD